MIRRQSASQAGCRTWSRRFPASGSGAGRPQPGRMVIGTRLCGFLRTFSPVVFRAKRLIGRHSPDGHGRKSAGHGFAPRHPVTGERASRRYLFPVLVGLGIAASQGAELFVNRILRPDAAETVWISEAVLAAGFVVVTWLWVRLRETQIALTDLERQQIVAETQLTIAARVQTSLLPALPGPSRRCQLARRRGTGRQDWRGLLRFPAASRRAHVRGARGRLGQGRRGGCLPRERASDPARARPGRDAPRDVAVATCRRPCSPTRRAASTSPASSQSSTGIALDGVHERRAPCRRAVDPQGCPRPWRGWAAGRPAEPTRGSKRKRSCSATTISWSSCRTASRRRWTRRETGSSRPSLSQIEPRGKTHAGGCLRGTAGGGQERVRSARRRRVDGRPHGCCLRRDRLTGAGCRGPGHAAARQIEACLST